MSDMENFELKEDNSNDGKKQLNILVKKLVTRAKAQGFLTYDEVNNSLPRDNFASDNFDYIVTSLTDAGISLVENIEDIIEPENDFDIEGLEGDDEIMLLSHKFAGNQNVELLVFCTDGDLNQVVKDNCMLFRNIRSNDVPNGEFVISLNTYNKIFENNET